jgi:cell wall-associated NlpC family hydrolase
MGLVQWKKGIVPDYPRDQHMHRIRERLAEKIEEVLPVKRIELENFKNGDIILFQFGKASAHATIYFDGYLYQSLTDIGVRRININDKEFRMRMRYAYRVVI